MTLNFNKYKQMDYNIPEYLNYIIILKKYLRNNLNDLEKYFNRFRGKDVNVLESGEFIIPGYESNKGVFDHLKRSIQKRSP